MKIRKYFSEVFVEPESYEAVRGLKRGDALTIRKTDGKTEVFLGDTSIGHVRGRKRSLVSALFEFEREVGALFFNMNEKEGVMLVKVAINDEPYK